MSIFSKRIYDIYMRNFQKEALILSVRNTGENNRIVSYLTKDEGILTSVLYGGPKSKLRSLVSPFNYGNLYLYNDEVKHSSKITDFDVKKYHLTFRESLFKTWAATLAVEVVISTKCAGSPEECFIMLNGFIDGLDLLDEEHGQSGLIRFLWRYIGLLGVQPDTSICQRCHKPFYSGTFGQNTLQYRTGGANYSHSENGFVCSDCYSSSFDNPEGLMFSELSSRSVVYLQATSVCEPSVSRNMKLSKEEIENLKGFVYSLIESSVGTKIKTLHSGIGIL